MSDNVGYTPGTGETIATDDVGGVQFQRIKVALGADGQYNGDVSGSNPMPTTEQGELVEALESLRMHVSALTRSVGLLTPDTAGRLRVLIDSISASLTLGTITTVGTVTTVTTVSTVTNQSQVGGWAANDQLPVLMNLRAHDLRNNIQVT